MGRNRKKRMKYQKDKLSAAEALLPKGVYVIGDPNIICRTCRLPRQCTESTTVHKDCESCFKCGDPWLDDGCMDATIKPQEQVGEGTQLAMVTTNNHPNNCLCPDCRGKNKTSVHSANCKCISCERTKHNSGGTVSYSTTPVTTTYSQCTHFMDTFEFDLMGQPHTLLITSKFGAASKEGIPDFGVYFDKSWESLVLKPTAQAPDKPAQPKAVFAYGGAEFPEWDEIKEKYEANLAEYEKYQKNPPPKEAAYPAIIIDWPDRGIITLPEMAAVMKLIIKKVKAGERVEVGCIGAHGRTGTFLACLLIATEKLPPNEAIDEVRKRHCKRTIESVSQVQLIFAAAGKTIDYAEANKLTR